MGWMKALFGRLTLWSSKKSSSDSSSSYPPEFVVDRTEVAAAITTGVPELTLRDLNKATRSFSAAMLISRSHNNTTAVYRASLPIGNNGKAAAVAKVLVLSRLRHYNVVRLLGYTINATADVRVLLFEFADIGTLYDALHGPPTGKAAAESFSSSSSRPVLSWAQRTGIALDVARGLEYLHDVAAVSHWGISSTKVLLFHGFRAKIAHYDLFMQLPQDKRGSEKATWYHPPE